MNFESSPSALSPSSSPRNRNTTTLSNNANTMRSLEIEAPNLGLTASASSGSSVNGGLDYPPPATRSISSTKTNMIGPNHYALPNTTASDDNVVMDPHASELGGDMTSAILGIIKAMVGPAILYLPHGFVKAGYLVALPIMGVATCLYLHSSNCLLETWKWESEKQLVPQQDDDFDVIEEQEEQDDDHSASIGISVKREHAQAQAQAQESLSYPELAYRAFGSKGETSVKVGIALMQSGVCLTYLIFVPHNLHSSLLQLTGIRISATFFLVLMLAFEIPLSFIRDIRKFTTTNALANCLILYGLLLCLWFALAASTEPYNYSNDNNDNTNINKNYYPTYSSSNNGTLPVTDNSTASNERSLYNLWQHLIHLRPLGDHWILFIGTSVLLFEGSITLLIPLQEAVQETPNTTSASATTPTTTIMSDRERFPFVYPRVILAIQVFYFIFAVTCWMSFGDNVHTVLTTSLPEGFLATTVQLAYSIAVLFTFPLQNYPALEIACHSIAEHVRQMPLITATIPPRLLTHLLHRNSIAAGLVCCLGIVAICTMESLDKVVSLTGAMIGIPIAFIFPPMIHSQLIPSISDRRRQQNLAVSVLGGVAMVLASVTTIYQWND